MVSMCQRNRRIILESPHTSDWFVLLHGKYNHPHLIYNKQTLHTREREREAKLKSLKWTFVCVDMRACVCARAGGQHTETCPLRDTAVKPLQCLT